MSPESRSIQGRLEMTARVLATRSSVLATRGNFNNLIGLPLTLLRHHFRRHPTDWVLTQVYLNPHPHELMLHNRV